MAPPLTSEHIGNALSPGHILDGCVLVRTQRTLNFICLLRDESAELLKNQICFIDKASESNRVKG